MAALVAIVITRARSPKKLLTAHIIYENGHQKHVSFGDPTAEQYPIHKDEARRKEYIARHKKRENWTISGLTTSGFWSRWLLWESKTIKDAINKLSNKLGVPIIM